MKSNIFNVTFLILSLFILGCKKDAAVSPIDVSFKLVADKTWYLNYAKEGSILRTYIGQPTYYITFLSDNTTNDSDGLTGNFTLSNTDKKLKLTVQAKTRNGSTVNYTYDIISVGSSNLILSFLPSGQSSITTLYYSIKQ